MRRGGVRRSAAKAGLRRPAAAVGAGHKSPQERWEQGEEVKSKEYSPGLVGSGDWFKSVHAVYFEKECEIAGHSASDFGQRSGGVFYAPDWNIH